MWRNGEECGVMWRDVEEGVEGCGGMWRDGEGCVVEGELEHFLYTY